MAQSRWSMLGAALGGGIGQGINSSIMPILQSKVINKQIDNLNKNGFGITDEEKRAIIMQSVFGIKPESAFDQMMKMQQYNLLNQAMGGGMGGYDMSNYSQGSFDSGSSDNSGSPANPRWIDDPKKNPNFGKPLSQGGADAVATMIGRNQSFESKLPAGTQMVQDDDDNVFYQTPDGKLYRIDGSLVE